MPVVSYRIKMRVSFVAALAAALCWMVISAPSLEAQDPPSIVGSAPLSGLSGGTGWINSSPLTAKQLKGKVVLVDFWDYSCINCIRAIPYVRAWAEKYKDSGLVVIGVHAPEFDIEKQTPNVQKAVNKFQITYPVVLDNNMQSGMRSTINTGLPTTSSIPKERCATSTLVRVIMTNPRSGSRSY